MFSLYAFYDDAELMSFEVVGTSDSINHLYLALTAVPNFALLRVEVCHVGGGKVKEWRKHEVTQIQ